MERLTLAEWLQAWPYVGARVVNGRPGRIGELPDGATGYVVADVGTNGRERAEAWLLADYLVSSVSGGSIWFVPRRNPRAF